ncbi:MAG: aminoglycoside phosphotransferase family protein, partial [Flavobacteriaceae bacterium]|nr:aminoglycoside phosphotransferase family protein [Flavobacteriaceae bacterium]
METVIKAFLGEVSVESVEPLQNGLINQTFRLRTAKGDFVLQKINTKVFTNVKGLMENIRKMQSHLESKTSKFLEFVPTQTGLWWYTDTSSKVWRLMRYIANTRVYNSAPNVQIAFSAGVLLGNFHEQLQDVDIHKFETPLKRFHDINWRWEQLHLARETALNNRLKRGSSLLQKATVLKQHLASISWNQMPLRLCHNDTKLNNMLFNADGKGYCLIDLDTLMPGYFIYDFGDAIRTVAIHAHEAEQDISSIQLDDAYFEAFIQGLSKVKHFLQHQEVENMVMGGVLMPFLHGIRALTDYYENDTYYQVRYSQQNLDRSRSLLRVAELFWEAKDSLQEIVYR